MSNILILKTNKGDVKIEMLPKVAPKHVDQIKKLVVEGAYNGVVFHRVIEDFMAQTGDVKYGNKKSSEYSLNAVGTGGSNEPDLPAEFSGVSHERGTVSMARSSHPDSANSQFFICFDKAPWLDGEYTVWGRVIEGMDNIDKIKRGEPVQDPDFIEEAFIE